MKFPTPYLRLTAFIESEIVRSMMKSTMGRSFGVIADIQYADADDASDFR